MKEQIPKAWKKFKMSDLVSLDGRILTPSTSKEYEFQYISLSDVNNGIVEQNLKSIQFENAPSRARKIVQKNDILFSTVRPNLEGHTKIVTDVDNLVVSTGFSVLSPKNKSDRDFIYQYLFSNHIRKQIYCLVVGSSYPAINSSDVASIQIIAPYDIKNRNAIASLLSTWDSAIEKTERLIELKESVYSISLDRLVFRKRSSKWKEILLGNAFTERNEPRRDDLPLLSISREEGITTREDTNRKDTSNEDKSKYLRICHGDIGYNTMRMWQGVSALSAMEGIVSPAYTICIPNEKIIDGLFASYLFKHPWVIHQFYRHSQGLTSDTWNLKFKHFAEIKLWIPPLDKQKSITDELSLQRQEIDLLKQKAAALKNQKRGLMQKLLTGEGRIKPEIIETYKETQNG